MYTTLLIQCLPEQLLLPIGSSIPGQQLPKIADFNLQLSQSTLMPKTGVPWLCLTNNRVDPRNIYTVRMLQHIHDLYIDTNNNEVNAKAIQVIDNDGKLAADALVKRKGLRLDTLKTFIHAMKVSRLNIYCSGDQIQYVLTVLSSFCSTMGCTHMLGTTAFSELTNMIPRHQIVLLD
jgi:hypothetical protein